MADEFNGFGVSSFSELEELRKALSVSPADPPVGGTAGDADPLRPESLEATLKVLTYAMSNLRLWQAMPKTQAFSTVEEFNQLNEYGDQFNGSFVPGGILPEEEDSTYTRVTEAVKYLGTTRVVEHPATVVRTLPADLIAQETQNGVLWLLRQANLAFYEADADSLPTGWNGYKKQIDALSITGGGDVASGVGDFTNVVDLRGQPLTQDSIEDGTERIVSNNFGSPTALFSNPKVFSDFSKTFHTFQRFSAPNPTPGVVGTPVTGYETMAGTIRFEADIFSRKTQTTTSAAVAPGSSSKVPSQGTSLTDAAPATDADSKFAAADVGQYYYASIAFNRFGIGQATTETQSASIPAGQSVVLTHTHPSDTGDNVPTGLMIFRSLKDASASSTLYHIGTVPITNGGTTTFEDRNYILPNTYSGLLLDMTNQSLTFRQLLPMLRMPLATIAPSIRWMQLLYGTPVVFAPGKNLVYVNIGDAV